MKQLLIDGVNYDIWTPPKEDDLETLVQEHAQDIFGEQSLYFNIKRKLKSQSGIGSIPDGYVITLGDTAVWHIVEIELSSHDLYQHIVSQVSKFISGIQSPHAQNLIANAIYDEIGADDLLALRIRKAVSCHDVHKFLSDLVSQPPILTVIVEEETEQLKEALKALSHQQIKVVEFQTYARRDVGIDVHAHLFEPLFTPRIITPASTGEDDEEADRYTIRYRFWDQLLQEAKGKTELHAARSPGQYSWIGAGAGKGGLSFNYYIRQHDGGIELYIDRGKGSEVENEAIFDQLLSHKDEIEKVFGEPLIWERLEGKRACRISKTFGVGGYRDEDKWPEVRKAMIDAMIRFEKALRPFILKLKIQNF